MFRFVPAVLLGLFAGPALAQWPQNCVTVGLLRVDAGFSRPGSGGTFNYSAQITNVTNRRMRFRITFRMTRAQLNPANASTIYILPPGGSQIYLLANGPEISTPIRVVGGVLLSCLGN